MTTRESVIQAVTMLATTFNRPVTAEFVEAYQLGMSGLGPDDVARALKRALRECKFMPAPAELIALSGASERRGLATAEAWEAVRRAIDVHDYTTSVDFGPLVNAILRNMGGWLRLCDLPLEGLDVWARKEFERLYAEFAEKDPATLHGEPHRGAFGGPFVPVAIGGKLPPRALPPPAAPAVDVVRELAEAKSDPPPPPSAPPKAPPVPAVRPKAPPMTQEQVETRKAEIRAQMAARGVTL